MCILWCSENESRRSRQVLTAVKTCCLGQNSMTAINSDVLDEKVNVRYLGDGYQAWPI